MFTDKNHNQTDDKMDRFSRFRLLESSRHDVLTEHVNEHFTTEAEKTLETLWRINS